MNAWYRSFWGWTIRHASCNACHSFTWSFVCQHYKTLFWKERSTTPDYINTACPHDHDRSGTLFNFAGILISRDTCAHPHSMYQLITFCCCPQAEHIIRCDIPFGKELSFSHIFFRHDLRDIIAIRSTILRGGGTLGLRRRRSTHGGQ